MQGVKSVIKDTGKKPGPNTEIYGPRSEYGFLQTARRPIRMQDSSKPYNNIQLLDGVEQNIVIYQWQADQLFADAEDRGK